MADQEPPLVNLLSTEAKAKYVEGHNTIKEVSRRIQDDGYREGHGRRNVALVGDWRIAGNPAGRRYPQTVQKISRAAALLIREL
ncbi:hypothetical protein GO003_019335 [Methylicorpusculum oleiharenae]|uniref:hypothetical protein n=1 Tax=Methylicorpusculum oleiharenae TaxID=1338687 RepID=UPI001E3BD7E8|nr:hypothetical protein [Methylicorpusculum oleiharenae]MCD2452542.1 hypothetical protein [Methylicorpusculum oleiharenae]